MLCSRSKHLLRMAKCSSPLLMPESAVSYTMPSTHTGGASDCFAIKCCEQEQGRTVAGVEAKETEKLGDSRIRIIDTTTHRHGQVLAVSVPIYEVQHLWGDVPWVRRQVVLVQETRLDREKGEVGRVGTGIDEAWAQRYLPSWAQSCTGRSARSFSSRGSCASVQHCWNLPDAGRNLQLTVGWSARPGGLSWDSAQVGFELRSRSNCVVKPTDLERKANCRAWDDDVVVDRQNGVRVDGEQRFEAIAEGWAVKGWRERGDATEKMSL